MAYDFDLFVIGAGSGGVRAARFAAGFGAKVGVAESRYLGGTCVNVGCVPKKLLVYGAHFAEDFEQSAGFGWSLGEANFDWATLIANKDREIARLEGQLTELREAGLVATEGRSKVCLSDVTALARLAGRQSRHPTEVLAKTHQI